MARFVSGDVVVVPFPFTDLSNLRVRRAVGRLQPAKLNQIQERVTAKRKGSIEVARAFSDYDVVVDKSDLPSGVEVIELL